LFKWCNKEKRRQSFLSKGLLPALLSIPTSFLLNPPMLPWSARTYTPRTPAATPAATPALRRQVRAYAAKECLIALKGLFANIGTKVFKSNDVYTKGSDCFLNPDYLYSYIRDSSSSSKPPWAVTSLDAVMTVPGSPMIGLWLCPWLNSSRLRRIGRRVHGWSRRTKARLTQCSLYWRLGISSAQ